MGSNYKAFSGTASDRPKSLREKLGLNTSTTTSLGSSNQQQIKDVTALRGFRFQCDSTHQNIEEWKKKLTMLLRNEDQQELVSREKEDRRDFNQISALATTMGLYSRQYAKAIIFSKFRLPNYRPDLDDMRPQREVIIPLELQLQVHDLIRAHISKKPTSREILSDNPLLRSSSSNRSLAIKDLDEQQRSLVHNSSANEKILLRKSWILRCQQQEWQESPEGQKMLEYRRSLPAYKERDALLKAISENQVVIVTGETGCGKTTQLPQYILESEVEGTRGALCSIICTQPRRISAMTVSERVAAERGEPLGESVGYKVRLEGTKGRDNRLLFCTTGILLRRLISDRTLRGISHVIVDEIHERGKYEDFLLIVLKELLPRRPELRVILMSATLNAELFSSYFVGAPTIHIRGFTHPVKVHFLEDILEMTGYRLTPQNQIDDYGEENMRRKRKKGMSLGKRKSWIASSVEDTLKAADFNEYSPKTRVSLSLWNPDSIGLNLVEHVLCHIVRKERPGAVLIFMTGWGDIKALKDQLHSNPLLGDPSKALLLACHSLMPIDEQKLIFDRPKDGVRKIILATNIAETSITIDDVVFVVDCGKANESLYDALNNLPCLLPNWISKAAAGQRRGRAGRVQPGECYHLYPRCVYDSLSEFQLPQILRTPLESLCLHIKSLQLGSISEFLSKAPQPPEPLSVQNAVEYLKTVGALDEDENLTVLGRYVSMLPVEPKLGKMLILGAIFNCLDPIMTVVASLSLRDPFVTSFDRRREADTAKAQFAADDCSDHLAFLRAYEGWRDAERQLSGYDYCCRNFLSQQTIRGIDFLRRHFFRSLKNIGLVDHNMESCSLWSHDTHLIRAIICAGSFPSLCSVMFMPQKAKKSVMLRTMEDGHVLLGLNSVNFPASEIPYPWLVFNEKVKITAVVLRDSTAVSDSVLLLYGGRISRGEEDGHLKMLDGYLDFFMEPNLADTYVFLKEELDELIQKKLLNPQMDIRSHSNLLSAVRLLISGDRCLGQFVTGREVPAASSQKAKEEMLPVPVSQRGTAGNSGSGDNSKNRLQTLLIRARCGPPTYKTKQLSDDQFLAVVIFKGMYVTGNHCRTKELAEEEAAAEALLWLQGEGHSSSTDSTDRMLMVLDKNENVDMNFTGGSESHVRDRLVSLA
ncbi:putative ATP-dependent RNA helicase DHX36 [Morus notabilis]|uniref:RNA helicase n=1 Tax=Morus notabilis TaxID=981085 RepID=W9QE30_9ROSA|nr:putative ATP-dependent RNA helicase DHX36 [Morus notabilis]